MSLGSAMGRSSDGGTRSAPLQAELCIKFPLVDLIIDVLLHDLGSRELSRTNSELLDVATRRVSP